MELLEAENPVLVETYGFIPDSGGAGKHRGGLGLRKRIKYLQGSGYFTNRSDATKFGAAGALGGKEGKPAQHFLFHPDGSLERLPSKATNLSINAGDVMILETAGGGGYGSPLDREIGLVQSDVANGKVSAAAARDAYGVVFDSTGSNVDEAATAKWRTEHRSN